MLGKSKGFPCGQFQDSGAAHSTVCNEKRTTLSFALGQDPYARLLDGKSGQAGNSQILDVQGKKRRNQWLDPMAKGFDQFLKPAAL